MQKRKSITGGIILIAVGALILLFQMVPGLSGFLDIGQQWPLIFVLAGAFFIIGAFAGTPDMAIPGAIFLGLGGIFYYQNLTGNWSSWAYVWALIPGFVGIGMVLSGFLDGTKNDMKQEGKRLIGISAILFLVFAFFFTQSWQLVRFWPVLLIAAGLWLLLRNRKQDQSQS